MLLGVLTGLLTVSRLKYLMATIIATLAPSRQKKSKEKNPGEGPNAGASSSVVPIEVSATMSVQAGRLWSP